MAAGAGLRALAALEVEGLHFFQQFLLVAKFGAGQLVEIPGILLLLLRQHAALAGTDAGARHFGTPGQGDFCFLGQGPKTHVGHKQRHAQGQRFARFRANDQLGGHVGVVRQGLAGHLRHHQLQIVPVRQVVAGHAHGRGRPMVAHVAQAFPGQLIDKLNGGFFFGGSGFRGVAGLAFAVLVVAAVGFGRFLANLIIAELLVGAIAVRRATGLLALAQHRLLVFFRLEDFRLEACVCVGTVAEGLVAGATAHAERVFLSFLQGDFLRLVISDHRIAHRKAPVFVCAGNGRKTLEVYGH